MKTRLGLMLVTLSLMVVTTTSQAQNPEVTHNTWTSGAPLPTAVWAPGGAAVLSKQMYVVGGVNAANAVIADTQIYNPATNSWTIGVSLPTPTCNGAAAVVKNVLYFIGGSSSTDGSTQTNAVWAYSPKTKTWSAKAAMPTARQSVGAVVEKNIIYVVGGRPGLLQWDAARQRADLSAVEEEQRCKT